MGTERKKEGGKTLPAQQEGEKEVIIACAMCRKYYRPVPVLYGTYYFLLEVKSTVHTSTVSDHNHSPSPGRNGNCTVGYEPC